MCRRNISFFIISDEGGPSDAELDIIRTYNSRFGEHRGFIERIRDAPFMINTLIAEIVSTRGLIIYRMLWAVMCILSSIAYVLSPFDLIPEAIFGLVGLIDDIFYVLCALIYCANYYN